MTTRIEYHIIQSFAPANLNRDDTGAPKDTVFGGARRGRISSQSLKRAARIYMRDRGLVPDSARAWRTKRVIHLLTDALVRRDIPEDQAAQWAAKAIEAIGSNKKMKVKDGKTEYLMFIGAAELEKMSDLLAHDISSGATKIDPELESRLSEVLLERGAGAIDIALFGRMLANLPEGNTDAACQVAHAISTHRVDREFDYYTAVDDLQPDDTAGADMIGTIEFNASCYYRYSVIDLDQLAANLGDRELARKAVEAYTRAVVEAVPSGKQNTFAAHNPPTTVLITIRHGQAPRNLANAFECPVPANGTGVVSESVKRLASYWSRVDAAYGAAAHALVLDISDAFPQGPARQVPSVDELASAVVATLG